MPLIPPEALPHFENQIYLPMLLIILERDRLAFEKARSSSSAHTSR